MSLIALVSVSVIELNDWESKDEDGLCGVAVGVTVSVVPVPCACTPTMPRERANTESTDFVYIVTFAEQVAQTT